MNERAGCEGAGSHPLKAVVSATRAIKDAVGTGRAGGHQHHRGVAPSIVTVVSPTELRFTHPALAAGSYFGRMHDAQGAIIDRSTAHLVVMDAANYTSGTLAYPADTRTGTFSPERGPARLYVTETSIILIA